MSLFHSTVSRREFMKFMGVAGAGVGVAALTAPVFHDVDELAASAGGVLKRPWFVKERAINDPTIEIDWSMIKRADCRLNGQSQHGMATYYGPDRAENCTAVGTKIHDDGVAGNKPGYSYRNEALRTTKASNWPAYVSQTWEGTTTNATWTKGGGAAYAPAQTPAQRGAAKWTGTPEEGTNLLAAYMRYRGSGLVGFGELTGDVKSKVISANHKGPTSGFTRPATGLSDNAPIGNSAAPVILFEDVDQGYIGTYNGNAGGKYVVPNKSMYYISMFNPGNPDRGRGGPSCSQQGATQDTAAPAVYVSTYNFLRYLGYQWLGQDSDDGTPFLENAAAVLTGVGEAARQNLYTLTPEYGNMGRIHNNLTDLPLAPTKPIDAGMFRFCHSCHKCANFCPPGSITQDKEPSWELPQIDNSTTGVKTNYLHNPGTKAFWNNTASCMLYFRESYACFQCWGNCTFTTNQGAMAHMLVRSIIPNFSLLNGFFYKMGEAFGYGDDVTNQKAEDWWNYSLPVFGTDTTRVAFDGGYSKWT